MAAAISAATGPLGAVRRPTHALMRVSPPYLAEVLGEEPMRLARSERQEMIQMLSAKGMSTRAIAPIVGVSDRRVRQIAEEVGSNFPPAPIEGMDGKTYTRPEPRLEPVRNVAKELGVINDIRLCLDAIASSRQVAGLTPKGKQHIIDAANNLIAQLQRNS